MTPQDIKDITKLPYVDVPYINVEKEFSFQVTILMDRLARSKAGVAKLMLPAEFKWKIHYEMADDPVGITDEAAFVSYLCDLSRYFLKATGGGWIGIEPINTTPGKLLAIYEQRARRICAQRRAERDFTEQKPAVDQAWEVPLTESLDQWLRAHKHNQQLAAVARFVLQELIDSAEE